MGIKTYMDDKVGSPDAGSSLGIEPEGQLVFDPWCMTGIWKNLSGGNIFSNDMNLQDVLDGETDTILSLARIYTAPHLRCKGCKQCCSGGSRIVAAASTLSKIPPNAVTDSHILDAMTSIDPACPLYKNEM
jgi:hypothetical protein